MVVKDYDEPRPPTYELRRINVIIWAYMAIDLDKRRIKEVVFLGDKVSETNYRNGVVAVANEIVQDVFNEPDPNIQVGNVNDLVNGLSGGKYKDVDEVEDAITTSGGKDRDAVNTRDVLCDSLLLAMRDGGDPIYSTALNLGNTTNIENVLPDNLQVWGRDVRNRHIDDANITAVLDQLSAIDDFSTRDDRIKLLQTAGRSLNGLVGAPAEQLNLAGNAVKKLFDQVDNPTGAGSSDYLKTMAESAKKSADIAQKQVESIDERSSAALENLLDSYLAISPTNEPRKTYIWEVEPPQWAKNFNKEDWQALIGMEDSMLGAVAQFRNGEQFKNFENISKNWDTTAKLAEEDLQKWYYDPRIKLKEVLHKMARELVVRTDFHETINGAIVNSHIYEFAKARGADGKDCYTNPNVVLLCDNQTTYKKEFAQRLVDDGTFPNIKIAKLAVSMATNVWEAGGGIAAADQIRKFNKNPEAVRFAMRPVTKVEGKVLNQEFVLSMWGLWAKQVTNNEQEALVLMQRLKVIPQLLSGAFWDMPDKTTGVTWADQIYNNQDLGLKKKYDDVYTVWKKDSLAPACDFMNYLTQKVPLAINRIDDIDIKISQWLPNLANTILSLRSNGVSLVPIELVCATIGASANIWPTEGHYLRIANTGTKLASDYLNNGNLIIEALPLSQKEEDYVRNFFGISFGAAYGKVAPQINGYSAKNKGIPEVIVHPLKTIKKKLFK